MSGIEPHGTLAGAPSRLDLPGGGSIAYRACPGKSPGVLFLPGFKSDMNGTKATALEAWCRARGRAFLRFDYSGHGRSSGAFADGTIGLWAANAVAVLDGATTGPQILVGSSMGGWIMLLAALARPARVMGLVGIAPAPDFTEDILWHGFDDETRNRLLSEGVVEIPSDYGEEPYPVTRRLIEEGRNHLVLRKAIRLRCPVRLLHGMADAAVPWQTSLRLQAALESDDVVVTLIKNGAHRLSGEADLRRLFGAVEELAERASSLKTRAITSQ